MCRAVRCRTCGNVTWSGCGAHVAQVRARVPAEQWCNGHDAALRDDPSWLRRILRRVDRVSDHAADARDRAAEERSRAEVDAEVRAAQERGGLEGS